MDLYYNEDYDAAEDRFDTTSKAKQVADSLTVDPIPGVRLVSPPSATVEELLLAHDKPYVDAIRCGKPLELACSQGFDWGPGLWRAVTASTGGVLAAARRAVAIGGVAGSLSSGLHHAKAGVGYGFCTFNGLAVAAVDAIASGVDRVLCIDLDAHGAGGTVDCVGARDQFWQLDVSVCEVDSYLGTNRLKRRVACDRHEYLPTIEAALQELSELNFGLCLYNAGVDPHEDCDVGGLVGIDTATIESRERLVFDWCRTQAIPTAFVLAGGYEGPRLATQRLIDLHRLTLKSASSTVDSNRKRR